MAKTAFIFGAQVKGLSYTDNDLTLVSEALKKHQYSIIKPETKKKFDLLECLENTASGLNQSDTFILYFSGHGIVKKGKFYFCFYNNSEISFLSIMEAISDCYAKNKLIIIDSCNSGNAVSDWDVKIDEDNFCLLTATKRLMPTKEFAEYKASFLSYHISKALLEDYPRDKENRITARSLREYLEEKQREFNNSTKPDKIEKPMLYGGNNFEITQINSPLTEKEKTYSSAIKNVCFVSSEYPPNIVGGLGVHVFELTKNLAHSDSDIDRVDIILPYLDNRDNYNFTYNPKLSLHPLTLSAKASYNDPYSWIRYAHYAIEAIGNLSPKPDIIHCHDWVSVLVGIGVRWKYKIPMVLHIHLPNKRPFCASIENLGIICADLVTVSSCCIKDEIHQRFIKNTLNIRVIPNGVCTDTFKPLPDWPVSDDYILFVGRLVNQKGVEYLIRAFYYITEKFDSIKLKIVGEGEQEELLKQLCINYLLDNKVEFLGFKKGPELVELYQKAKLVVVPSIYEPFGMIVLEAMACRKPVVASNLMGLKELIIHNETGFLFESEDYLDLAQWVMALLNSSVLSREMGLKGEKFILENKFVWNEIAKEYIKLYNEISISQMNYSISHKMVEYKDQIVRLAREYYERSGQKKNYLDSLFEWIK